MTRCRTALLVAALMSALAAQAADTWSTPTTATDPMADARHAIDRKDWTGAVAALARAPQPDNADWHNLMGYSLRKGRTPDLVGAEQHYDRALALDPHHRGALEYSGELYLMKGDLPRAEARLAALEQTCHGCEEQDELQRAIADFKTRH